MQIKIKLSPAQVQALDDLLSTQIDQVANPISGNVKNVAKYANIEDFVLKQVAQIIKNALTMYPPASVQADITAITEAQERIALMAKVEVVAADPQVP